VKSLDHGSIEKRYSRNSETNCPIMETYRHGDGVKLTGQCDLANPGRTVMVSAAAGAYKDESDQLLIASSMASRMTPTTRSDAVTIDVWSTRFTAPRIFKSAERSVSPGGTRSACPSFQVGPNVRIQYR
jgi:hypothetical protein